MLLISGSLGVMEVAANTIVLNIARTLLFIGMGFMQSSVTLCAIPIGKNDMKELKNIWHAHLKLGVMVMIGYFVVFYSLSSLIVEIFTPNQELQTKCKSVMLIIAIFLMTSVLRGILRGTIVAFGM